MDPISIPGVGSVPINNNEYTSKELYSQYLALMTQIQQIFNKPTITDEDYGELLAAMNQLKELAENGDGNGAYFDQNMANGLKSVFDMLAEVGITTDGYKGQLTPTESMKVLKDQTIVKNGKTYTFVDIIDTVAVQGTKGADQTLQAMLYSDFVLGVNQVYEDKLNQLGDQLECTKNTLDTLAALDDLLNLTEVANPANYAYPPQSMSDIPPDLQKKLAAEGLTTFEQINEWLKKDENATKYVSWSNDYFAQPIVRVPIDSEMDKAAQDLLRLRDELTQEIETMKNAGGEGTTLVKNMEEVLNLVNKSLAPYDDYMKKVGPGPYDATVQRQITESLHVSATNFVADSGSVKASDKIATTTTGAQNLSQTQTDELNKEMTLYQQFQSMAISLMAEIGKIITRFAQGAKG